MAKHIPYEENHRINNKILEKKCNRHYIYFPSESEWMPCTIEYFYTNKKNKSDGLHPTCKKCERLKAIKWKKENPERFAISQAKVEAKKERKISNRKRAEKQRKAGKQKEWQLKNPDKVAEYNQTRQHKNHKITITEWDACKEYFNNSCAYCGLKIEDHYRKYAGQQQKIDLHKEHADYNGNDDLSNCIPSCGSCNDKKWKFTLDEWYNKDNPVYIENRYNKIVQWLNYDYKLYIEPERPKRKYAQKKRKPNK